MPESPLNRTQATASQAGATLPPQVILVQPPRQTVWWVIALTLAVIATVLVGRFDGQLLPGAAAQYMSPSGQPMMGARGIYAFTGQLGTKDYGLFMVDIDTGTLWCYQLARGREGELQLQLVAARSWIFDRFLEEFNVAKPTPSEVQMMVRQQRGHASLVTPGPGTGVSATRPSGGGAGTPFVPALPKDENTR
jgi:hypothetical protein